MTRTLRTRPVPVLVALGLIVVLAACGASAGSPVAQPADGTGSSNGFTGRDEGSGPVAQPPVTSDGKGGAGGVDTIAALANRQIVKTGEITIEVSNVGTAMGKVRALALQLGGYVGASQIGGPSQPYPVDVKGSPGATLDGALPYGGSATLTLRIPADRFDEAITRLHELPGTVVAEATSEQDVTSQVVDIQARLANLQASEVQYRELLAKATKIEDILAVQTRLDDVRGQIEQWQAQQKQLADVADLATLTVTLSATPIEQATSGWDPGKTVTDAFASLVTVGRNIANGAIWFAIVWLPGLIVLALILFLVLRVARRWRRVPGMRQQMAPAGADAAGSTAELPQEKA
jgi:hypothetical protein